MNDVVMIQPTHATVGVRPVLEISLHGTPRGLVLLLCDRSDLDRDAAEVMNRLAAHGFESLAAEAGPLAPLVERAADRGWGEEQIGMVGLGLGGRTVLEAAAALRLGAAVSLSPTGALADVGAVITPWLGLFGAEDPGAPVDEVRALAARLDARSEVYTRVVTYPGVGRDFYRRSGDGLSYGASYDGWQRTVEWLELRVAPRLTPLAERWRRHRAAADA